MRATLALSLGGLLGLVALGCGQNSAPTATGTSLDPMASGNHSGQPQHYINGDLAQGLAGAWTLRIDPTALHAEIQPTDTRAAMANDDLYDLSIANFTRRDTLQVTRVARSASTLDIDYVVTHPFAAPVNLAGPATAANRADLGIAGQVVFLLDVNSASGNTYFTSAVSSAPTLTNVIANTDAMANADGYVRPAGLLPGLTTIANTFPYRRLVDDSGTTGSRVGIPNGGSPQGNYAAATGGWQQDNIGIDRNGWTGFGVLHQGQASTSTLSLDLAALSGGPLTIDTVILAKYNDPRSGTNAQQKRANRLPKSPTDINAFAYRMPHGALDIERVRFLGETGSGFIANQVSGSTLNFHVEDFDARAFETTEEDLAADPLLSNVAIGESGTPILAVSIPDVLGATTLEWDNSTDLLDDDSAFGGDVALDSGEPGDALFYSRPITNTTLSGQVAGPAKGLVMALDAEHFLSATDWRFALDPDLAPANPAPIPATFQAFTVLINGLSGPPVVTLELLATTIIDGGTVTVQASAYSDPESDPIEVRIDWNNDGDYLDPGESGNMLSGSGGAPVNFTSPITYAWSMSNPDTRTLPMQYTDNISAPITVTPAKTFTVIENTNMCGAPYVATSTITSLWSTVPGDRVSYIFTDMATNQTIPGISAFQVPTFPHPAPDTHAGWVAQRITSSPTYQIWRMYATGATVANGLSAVQLTNAPATFGTSSATARQVFASEVDSTNRVILATYNVGVINLGLRGPAGATGSYAVGAPHFLWFDTDGGATQVTDAGITTVAVPNPVVALTVDGDDNVVLVDNQNRLRRFLKASGYAEDVTAPFPINLTAGPYNIGVGALYVHDLAVSAYNGAIFLLTETAVGLQEAVYRIECDGTLDNPIPGTSNPNPLPVEIYDFASAPAQRPLGIHVDQRTTTGALLTSDSDIQILLSGFQQTTPGLEDWAVITSRLEQTVIADSGGVSYRVTPDTQRNWLLGYSGSAVRTLSLYGVPPPGWQ